MNEVAINGRFLLQKATGVQRYALNVVKALDHRPNDRRSLRLIAPVGAPDPGFSHIPLERKGRLDGHVWEQTELARAWDGPLLNLCNWGPVLKADQAVCIHDANVFTAPESYSRTFRTVYSALQPLLARRAARLATVSQASARQLARYLPVRQSDIAILPNGHEHALEWNGALAETAPQVVESLRRDDRQFVLALASRAPHKNLGLLMKIAEALDELGIDIVVAGGSSGIFASDFLQMRRNMRMVGRVSDDDLAYFLQSALCLVFPSFTEGFGLPIVEAMALGCPVVASDCASMPEVCGNAALMASPVASQEWIAHIAALRGSELLAEEKRGLGFEQVRKFSWADTAAGYVDLLESPQGRVARYTAQEPASLKVAVVVATRGRPDVVTATTRHLLSTQTVGPDEVIISCVDLHDAGDLVDDPRVTVVTGKPGLAAQRNRALASVSTGTDIVIFFDDDFVAHEIWLESAIHAFRDESRLVGFTGHVVADGIKGPGISFDDAVRLLDASSDAGTKWHESYSPYGCNMAFRAAAIGDARFDERLVLYGWLEDRDFAAALAKQGGRFVKSDEARGVHMGVKNGRVSGERLGYSQIVNPVYMLGKGTMTVTQVADQVLRNVASNFGRLLWAEPFIDRRGRAKGNLLAVADILRGRLEPERAAQLQAFGIFPQRPGGKAR
ncbi:glycosyltransferase involved in cell wall biosynthesis/GT2 family glycosyltransferase [Neorhizobium sp. 2083]|nr:glycosyltransferase involved in cell wall biosynthesis/GT2 family glycosyltransferase [Neorhizobium sp. 2083]